MRYFIIHLLITLFTLHSTSAAEYWTSPTGSATNSGSAASPWNLAKAGSAPAAGDTVHITAGIYGQRLIITRSGSATGGMITYRGAAGAILDGTALPIPTGDFAGLVHINGQRYLRVEGLEIRNWKTTSISASPVGIFVHSTAGATTDIQLVNNHVHDIWQRSAGAGAHGIGVYGNNATAISRLLIQGNELDHCQVGWSETLVVNGNVDGFEISDNNIHDNNNIGIDIIGYEGTAPSGSPDYARNGLIARNTVHNIHTNGYDASSANPAYATNDDSSGGIYVDGARDTVIERNLVYDCDIGIEIGAEHAGGIKNSTNCTIRNNIVHTTIQGCINLGGYAANLSWTENCLIAHNTCFNADTKGRGYGLIVLQKSRNCTFRNNIFLAQSGTYAVSATQSAANVIGHAFDWNIYWKTSGTPAFQLSSGSSFIGLSAFRTATGQDANSLQVNPLLISITSPLDFNLQASSSAINGGDPAFVAGSGETDFFGAVRIQGGRTDLGGYESGSTGSPTVIATQPSNVSVTVGQSATFSVVASGTAPLTYQWKRNGSNISGATAASYNTPATVIGDNGATFTVVVSNSAGSATSTSATLSVNAAVTAPAITTQPSNVSVTVGQTATFSVVASGTATLTYQWKRNGTTISGATAASYTTPATVIGDNGATFTVVVSNSAGSATANAATLTVNAVVTPPGTGTGTGLSASYFNNMALTAPSVLTRTDATLNFSWAGSPGPGINADGFSVRWTGKVQAPITGTYTFFTNSDDGIRLWVNGTQLINNWTDHGAVEDSGSIALVAGSSYDIRVEYYENAGGATAMLSWSCAGLAKQVMPQDRLYNATPSTVSFPLNPLAIGTSTLGSYNDNGSSITVAGSGSDIWNSSDGFEFASQSLTGDGTIVVRVASVQNTNAWAKAGVMVREGTGSGAKFAFCCVTSGNGVAFQRRTATNGAASHTAGSANGAPRWLKLSRAGSLLSGYESADGQTWTLVGSVTISMTNPVQIGLAVTSHNDGVLCTAVFDHLVITPSGNG